VSSRLLLTSIFLRQHHQRQPRPQPLLPKTPRIKH